MERVRTELVPKVKALCARVLDRDARRATRLRPEPPVTPAPRRPTDAVLRDPLRPVVRSPRPAAPTAPTPGRSRRDPGPIGVVAIGVSTGGPTALSQLLPSLPAELPVPIVVVQHMPPMFTTLLSQRLDATCALRVVEGSPGTVIEPGTVYVAPGGDQHMQVRRDGAAVRLTLVDSPPEHSCRPSVDALFRSVVDVYGGRVLAVVLTGMGFDGSGAAPALHAAGARILVQDEDSSVVWGMPGAIVRAGLADEVLPLADIAPAIVRRAQAARIGAARPIATSVTGR
jgi:two-component system chemotaxis response regulator CheB